jgi:hypothetical protein
MRDLIIAIVGIVAVAVLWSGWQAYQRTGAVGGPGPTLPISYSYKDAVFTIDGAPTTITSEGVGYFGNEAVGDLDGDGRSDTAFLVTHDGGGSGTFYYVIVALADGGGYAGTNAVLLGDRIAPQTTEIRDATLIVNYADRKPTESMTAAPSVGVSKYLKVFQGTLGVVE